MKESLTQNKTYTPLDQRVVVFTVTLDHPRHWVGEPFFEVTMGLKDVGHEKVHQRPEFCEIQMVNTDKNIPSKVYPSGCFEAECLSKAICPGWRNSRAAASAGI